MKVETENKQTNRKRGRVYWFGLFIFCNNISVIYHLQYWCTYMIRRYRTAFFFSWFLFPYQLSIPSIEVDLRWSMLISQWNVSKKRDKMWYSQTLFRLSFCWSRVKFFLSWYEWEVVSKTWRLKFLQNVKTQNNRDGRHG